jgi:DNA-directed RNA polymerase specialized sigma24 family protein
MSELELDLQDCTARQYAILILREDLKYSWQRCGNVMGVTRDAARELYKRARLKVDKE